MAQTAKPDAAADAVYIGLDIGGTKFLAAAGDGRGGVARGASRPTPQGLREGLDLLHAMIAELAGAQPIAGIGAAIGGPLDHATGAGGAASSRRSTSPSGGRCR